MTGVLTTLATFRDLLRIFLFWSALVVAVVAAVDWLVRTRRLNPFGPVARVMRRQVDPLLAPIERRVVRAGGLPSNAPWWALAAIVLGGILLLALMDFLISLAASVGRGIGMGPSGIALLLISWTFGVLQLAILVRVVISWLPLSMHSPWLRWSFTLSEPILRPLRRMVPPLGSVDISPIVAFLGLMVAENLVMGILR